MKFTNKITVFFVLGIWFLIVGCAGIGFQMIQPESFRGEVAATIFIPAGCALLLYVLYRMHQYRLNPVMFAADEKQKPDERMVRVQEKGAMVALMTSFFSLFFCAYYAEYICTIVLGVTDPSAIHSLGLLFCCLGMFSACVSFLSMFYYYYYTRF
ncbi:MAG TPA: hypothetical protein O0Y06_00260 [Methanocorpusculum sp.]|nr:hypothetical protein [Methanocorpusculum sp.]HJK79320.1 hypothetical protein [Methanocorpusculum sp.]